MYVQQARRCSTGLPACLQSQGTREVRAVRALCATLAVGHADEALLQAVVSLLLSGEEGASLHVVLYEEASAYPAIHDLARALR